LLANEVRVARYQVSIIERPAEWTPAAPDDVPPEPGRLRETLAESEQLFPAVRQAIDYNQSPHREQDRHWAVVVEPGGLGHTCTSARLCTPLAYQVTPVWWPTGWEPGSPFDVPNCVWQAPSHGGGGPATYRRALATVRALNRQSMDRPGTMWYVLIAVENEPVSRTVAYDASGTETTVVVRRLHVVRPDQGGKGDCTHCPAHHFACSEEEWDSLEQTASARILTSSRSSS
jgi:hypothetical protein